MRSRVLAPVLASAILATTISMLAACGPVTNPAQAGHQSSAAAQSGQSGPSVQSAPHGADPAPSHASAAAPPSPDTATKHTPAHAGKKQKTKASAQSPSAPGTGPVRFGLLTSDDSTFTSDVSTDGVALTALFADMEASTETGAVSNGTRVVIPLTGGAHNAVLTIYVSGYAFALDATARLRMTVNGQTVVRDFPTGTDDDFIQQIELPAVAGSQPQLSLALEVHQAPGSDGGAYLNVSSIDANLKN
jgi:hypothetical protein